MPNYQSSLDTTFQALADPTRRAVIARLVRGPATVSELAVPFEMALPSFMQHLRKLEQSGLIETIKRGRVRTCAIQPQRLQQAKDWLAEQQKIWEGRLDQLEAYLATLETRDTDND